MIVGVLGGGQLGRMLALAGYPLGLRFRFLDPDPECPAGQVGELLVGKYEDEDALARFVRGVDVVTYEFENVPARTVRWLTDHVPVFPPEHALATAQDRVSEKACFGSVAIGTAEHAKVDSAEELREMIAGVGVPCIVKTRRCGYDGKGQWMIRTPEDAARVLTTGVFSATGSADLILEAVVPFAREISVLGVRSRTGDCRFYPPVHNTHSGGVLARSVAPARDMPDAQRREMEGATARVMERLEYVGVLAVEYFDMGDGRFVANEMAPRVHNSGHWTIEGAECSQFENHVRAVCGMPLGSTAAWGHSVMLNVIGAEPAPAHMAALMAMRGVHVHMYGKTPRPGRKLGHVTVCAPDEAGAAENADRVAGYLRNC